MADVQIDDGEFTRVANVLLEKISRARLNGSQYSIVLILWRFTYGFQRAEHELSIGFISKATGIDVRIVKRELKAIIGRNIISVKRESTKLESRVLGFNKNYEQWVVTKKSPGDKKVPTSEGTEKSPGVGTKSTPNEGTKKSPKKESIKESIIPPIIPPSPKKKIAKSSECSQEFDLFWEVYPRTDHISKIETLKKWSASLRDKQSPVTPQQLVQAAKAYATDCKKNKTEEKFIKHPSTFLGPNKHYLAWIPKERGDPDSEQPSKYSLAGVFHSPEDNPYT